MKTNSFSKVILLGVDGLDPGILEKLMARGDLPNFSKIKKMGAYRHLATSNPSQSPVAWSTIASGSNPGYHGIFDFIKRNPKIYLPELAILKVNRKSLFGQYHLMFSPVRKGSAFWTFTSQAQIPTTVVRWPLTFPPEKISGAMLSGLGVPDLKGTLSWYTFYTTKSLPEDKERKGSIILLPKNKKVVKTKIFGPYHSQIPMTIYFQDQSIKITIQNQSFSLKKKNISNWIKVKFNLGFFKYISGICQFYLESASPEFKLYLSPLEVNPKNPVLSISYPENYAKVLAEKIGLYHTLGLPEDTNALNDQCLNEEAFLEQCCQIMREREKMLLFELKRFKKGLLAFVFDTTDRIQHIFWKAKDPQHRDCDVKSSKKYQNVIDDYYKKMDKILGKVLGFANKKTVIIILSDHGFTSFKRAVHLNSWLVKNGLMVLKNSGEESLFKNVNWKKTKAYAVGFTSLYLNLKGRERRGIVNQGSEALNLKRKIRRELLKLKDLKTKRRVIKKVYFKESLYKGPCLESGPDLVIGFEPGFRASWQTAVGAAPKKILEDNLKKWSGDHLVDPELVPGVFLINQKISSQNPSVLDIAPTILRFFSLSKPRRMQGNSLF